jgi:hypothetical protein
MCRDRIGSGRGCGAALPAGFVTTDEREVRAFTLGFERAAAIAALNGPGKLPNLLRAVRCSGEDSLSPETGEAEGGVLRRRLRSVLAASEGYVPASRVHWLDVTRKQADAVLTEERAFARSLDEAFQVYDQHLFEERVESSAREIRVVLKSAIVRSRGEPIVPVGERFLAVSQDVLGQPSPHYTVAWSTSAAKENAVRVWNDYRDRIEDLIESARTDPRGFAQQLGLH